MEATILKFCSLTDIKFLKSGVFRRYHVLGDPVNWGDPTGLAVSDILPAIQIAFGKAGKAIYDIALNGPPEARVALGLAAVTTVAPLAGSAAIFTVPALVPVAYQYAPNYVEVVNVVSGLFRETGPPQGLGYISSLPGSAYEFLKNYINVSNEKLCGDK